MGRASIPGLFGSLLLAALVGGVVWWLGFTQPLERFDLGAGEQLLARRGSPVFLVGNGHGGWRAFEAAARHPGDGVALPVDSVRGPVLAPSGAASVQTREGLYRLVRGRNELVAPAEALPGGAWLEGVASDGRHLLSVPVPGTPALRALIFEAWLPDAAPAGAERWRALADAEGAARLPDGSPCLSCDVAPRVAFIGERGWEAWRLPGPGETQPARARAVDHADLGAAFTPDGEALIVPGRTDGLWLLSLDNGQLRLMAEGNLGVSRRVGASSGFRGDPPLLVAPQWNTGDYLQVMQTHLGGGGRLQFTSGFVHHYGVALSHDGRFLAYAQADFSDEDDLAFEEELFVFDYGNARQPALVLGTRRSAPPGRGPVFVGDGPVLAWIADGEVELVHVVGPDR